MSDHEPCPELWESWDAGGGCIVWGRLLDNGYWIQLSAPDWLEPPLKGGPTVVGLMHGDAGDPPAWKFASIDLALEAIDLAFETGWPDEGGPDQRDPGSVGVATSAFP